MSDPSLIPEGAGDLAKLGGASGIGSLLTLLVGRLFKGQDKQSDLILVEVKALATSVAALTTQVALLGRTVMDVARLEETVHEQGLELAALRATVSELKDGLLR